MHTIVVYASKFGNTEKVAQAIGRGLGRPDAVRVMRVSEALQFVPSMTNRPDLLLLGGPTQRRGASSDLRSFVGHLPAGFVGIPVAVFDTRYRGPNLVMGSAAAEVAKTIRKSGGSLVLPPENFFMSRHGSMENQKLEPGELERAEEWGRTVGAVAASGQPAKSL